ncbi:MAG TPA: sensor histidine kinase [Bryobacteraceae bacterium]|nr:sensor histidine kinase [Bryobacteraceae bacterium]
MLKGKRLRLLPDYIDWTAYVWLVYLAYFLAIPFLFHLKTGTRIATVAGTLVAVPLYFLGYWLRGYRVLWVVGGFLVLAVVFAPFNPGAATLFVFAASALAGLDKQSQAFPLLYTIVAIAALESWLFHLPPEFWIPTMVFTSLIGSVVIQWTHRGRLTRKLLAAQAESEHLAKVAERERIGRDLHDLLGHTLSVIVLKSELASRLAESEPTRAAEEIRDVERISREALAQVRAAVRGYRTAGFDSELKVAMEALEAAGIQVETSIEPPLLSPAQETVFAMALREAVTNVVRHAHATVCRLTMRQVGRFCEMVVADNGRGGALDEGSGLSGMRERVEALGGALERDGSHGAQLRIRVPV